MASEGEILLIEDNMDEAMLTIRSLKKNHLANNLIHFDDGVEALDYIFARNEYSNRNVLNVPKLVLLDLKLPKIDGHQVLKAIKSDPRTNAVPVIILTSSNQEMDIAACYNLGANSYVVKPVNFESFSKAIVELGMYWMVTNIPPVVNKAE